MQCLLFLSMHGLGHHRFMQIDGVPEHWISTLKIFDLTIAQGVRSF